jgi:Ser/Thr protein kinase RdoA (MazF antagonist)
LENEVINAYATSVREEIFSTIGVKFDQVLDLQGFENFVYGSGDRVIRITHDSHRTVEQLLGELEFLRYLHTAGGAVSNPILFPGEAELITVGDFHVCQFERAAGVAAPMDEPFSTEVIRQWGRCLGVFHRLARKFEPVHPRQNWLDDENHQFKKRIPADQLKVLARSAELMKTLSSLEDSADVYGLIHSDAHAGNYLINQGSLTFFDFDDCLYTWYGYDVATVLLGVAIQPWVEDSQDAMATAVSNFLPVFIEGYSEENESGSLMWHHMHDFLRLRELSLYAVIHAHMDPSKPDGSLPRRFLRGRRERIEQGLPFVDLDFAAF